MVVKYKVVMFGPGLAVMGGISAVVNTWIEAGLDEKIQLRYVSTVTESKPGIAVSKIFDIVNAVYKFVRVSFKEIDIVHIHLSSGASFYRKLIIFSYAKLLNAKIFVHLHGSNFEEFYNESNPITQRLVRYMFNSADMALVLSKSWKAFIQSISSNKNINILYNGTIAHASELKINHSDELKILFMGRLGKRKGVYDLLLAFKKLSEELPNVKLVLGGDGEIEEVRKVISETNLVERVQLLGWVTGHAKQEAFGQADIYVLPSYNEGLPVSILEAMSHGMPILSTSIAGIPEAVFEGSNGFLIEPGDVNLMYQRLLELCKDEHLRANMGKRSLRLIEEKFDTNKIIDHLLTLYSESMSK